MAILRSWKIGFLLLTLIVTRAGGEIINWYCPAQKANLTSTGGNMDATFVFRLGVFSGGFIPTAANVNQWSAHWVTADSNTYNPSTKAFEGNFTVTGNAAPFTIGAKAYVWGRSQGSAKDEWILFRNTSWTWPAPNPFSPFPIGWNAATADQVILGSLNSGGTPFLMKSEAVISYSQWSSTALAGEVLTAPNDDPDHDGTSNLLEFIFGTSPVQSGPPTATPVSLVEISGGKYVQISIPRIRNRLAEVIVEVSEDLLTWHSGISHTFETMNTATSLVVRDLSPAGAGFPSRFMRARVVTGP